MTSPFVPTFAVLAAWSSGTAPMPDGYAVTDSNFDDVASYFGKDAFKRARWLCDSLNSITKKEQMDLITVMQDANFQKRMNEFEEILNSFQHHPPSLRERIIVAAVWNAAAAATLEVIGNQKK